MIEPWALEESATADIGDKRLDERMAILLSALGDRPNLSIPAACGGRAEMAAAYRFFDNDKVSFDTVLQPHRDQTLQRLRRQSTVLLVQDTTEIDLSRPQQPVEGAGVLDGGTRAGVLLHDMQAFSTDGVALGTVWAQVINRTPGTSPPARKTRCQRQHTPIEAKESLRWLTGLRQAREVAGQLPGVECVCVGDSEADIYELLAEPRGQPAVHWLIRACQNRALQEEAPGYLREQLLAAPMLYTVELKVRGRTAMTQVEERARRTARVGRTAVAQVRAATVTLRPPWRHDRTLPPVTANVVMVREVDPPPGEEPVEWILVTTLPIDTPEQVRRIVEYYCVRWSIEIFFRTLKSGCRVERRRFEHVERVLPCLAMYLTVAWRTMFVCHLGRACPEMDCEAIFEPSEWKALWVAVHRTKPPKTSPGLAVIVHLVASLGGYVERPHSEPGPQTLWVGLQRLHDLAWAWDAFGPGRQNNSS